MPTTTHDAVQAWLDVRGTEPGPLITSFSPAKHRSGRLVTRGIYVIIRALGAAVGVHGRPHGIRYTAITQAIDAAARKGLSIDDVVRQFSRHKAIGTLLIYRDLHDNKQGTIAEWVSEQLPASSGGEPPPQDTGHPSAHRRRDRGGPRSDLTHGVAGAPE